MKDKPTTDWTVVLRTSVITQIITAICTFAVTLSGTYCAQQWQDDRHLQERRRQAFGELMGVRATLTQVVRDFQDSKIHGGYNLQVYALTKDKIGLDEGRRYMQVNEALSTELARERKRMYEIIASIAVSFPEFPMQTYAKLNQVGFVPPIPSPGDIKTVEDLNEWHNKQLVVNSENVAKEVDTRLGKIIDQIAEKLVVTADHASNNK
jgi:hypothetical protein